MTNWSRRLSFFLGASLLLPLTSEFVVSRIKGENYDFGLAAALILIVGPIALLLYYARPVRLTARLIMSLGLMLCGLATAALGIMLTYWEDLPGGRTRLWLSIPAIAIGLLVASIGALYFGRERNTMPAELPAPPAPIDPTQVKIERYPSFRSGAHAPLIDTIIAHLDIKDLQYLAYFVDRACVMTLDLLDHPQLGRFHEVTEPWQRREEYLKQGKALHDLLQRLNDDLRPLNTGELIRLVLDVERGAIYYYLVTNDSGRYVVGVTLDQHKVHVADQKMALLVDDIRVHLGQPRMTHLEDASW
ncbi:MAG TPA: hypothetical protein VF062_12325 [Candidatus Limnocylindrales bacterium]